MSLENQRVLRGTSEACYTSNPYVPNDDDGPDANDEHFPARALSLIFLPKSNGSRQGFGPVFFVFTRGHHERTTP
jgi:hypothetical protein